MRAARLATMLLIAATLLVAAACGSNDPEPLGPIVSGIPWESDEAYRYTLTDGDGDPQGEGVLAVVSADGMVTFVQRFQDDKGNSDTSVLRADARTLEPDRGARVIVDADDDRRSELQTEYTTLDDGSYGVRIKQLTFTPRGEKEPGNTRCNPLTVAESSYDNDSSLFLWRTIVFEEGREITYNAVIANRRDTRPITLRVRRQERIEVPAGEFDAWLVGIEGEGETQNAWFATTPDHKLLAYDNDRQVFRYAGEADAPSDLPELAGVSQDCD